LTALLDVNVLVALAWPNHVHHRIARTWFEQNGSSSWATCSITENGFVRISSNPKVVDEARTPAEAVLMLQQLVRVGEHRSGTTTFRWRERTSVKSSGSEVTARSSMRI
jgi:toxin-antitoxin system PIN domain toxin